MGQNADNLIWIDLEMTGLDPHSDLILEVATIVTDKDLNVLAEGPVIAVRQQEAVLVRMDDWNRRTHGASGLMQRVRDSMTDELGAEHATLEFVKQWVPRNASPMCGNSICQDRRFLARCMPDLERYFHYRNLDVSTLKELARRWAPQVLASSNKEATHQALQDIRDSIAELRHYREHFIRLPAGRPEAE
ncbi:3'-to-5' oligoribonuclease (orn) [Thioalkalivibrio nitratireducens DSM 14787]|uniref:Oligoribonuclease n=1 Tax=Thioalkalivibrio nitratireducens (strain DSM 14787 / UNIQEM 213 / ALEN2) TaxID=1255043 RepID=L0DU21_THIND|nr:oligoribonuclease [Thioalkalivibrio nitratireducens]AGA32507.1 3'-to-5' oligoribonuclease (orn) [Thioalkalivibrio nitratireducens DSM 14787]